ncbi:MAG: dimethyladenosine transferase [Candidatus Magasanikbacteria bacterium]|nr:dimethyladenosine transferase [Candidatus Magasanikbacteria bacterium]
MKEILEKLGVRPSKERGQNFLIDERPLAKMIAAAELAPDDTVIEIGPGLGVLTAKLADALPHGKIIAIELEPKLTAYLKKKFRASAPEETPSPEESAASVEIIQGNALTYLRRAKMPPHYKIVANIPYQITGALMRILLETKQPPEKIVLMVQKEVADRLTAEPKKIGGSGEMSALTVIAQLQANVKKIANVSAGAFYPTPKVDSAIIALTPKQNQEKGNAGERRITTDERQIKVDERLISIVKKAFAGRRKKLGTTLKGIATLWGMVTPAALQEAFKESGITPDNRPQDLTIQDWRELWYNLAKRRE